MTNKNIPAFPNNFISEDRRGMSLRDYFAAKAMQGIAATLIQSDGEPFWDVIATDSYKMADAMLKAREK
jgi:hypothetical protein